MSVSSLELVPDLDEEVIERLRESCRIAESLQAVVAFWTMRPELFGEDLVRCLSGSGFLCVDIHSPTNIDQLAELRQRGANVYLHLFDIAGQTEDPPSRGVPPYLLHAKTLLFERPSDDAELWVGSHNWTQRALFGVNIEASLRVGIARGTPAHQQAVDFLEGARSRCQLLDPSLVPYYKWLQGDDSARNVIELEEATDASVANSKITLFGSYEQEYGQLKKVDREVIVAVTSTASGSERFYRSTIVNTGKLQQSAGKGVTFDQRRWAFRDGPRIPVLQPNSLIPQTVVDRAFYFATLELAEQLPEGIEAGEAPDVPRWVELDENDPAADSTHKLVRSDRLAISRLPARERTGRRGDREPRVRRAADPKSFWTRTRSLEERRKNERPLVTRRVFNVDIDERK